MEDQVGSALNIPQSRFFLVAQILIALGVVLSIGVFIAIVEFPGPMFSFTNVTALPFSIAVLIATLVCRRYWFVWPILVHFPLWNRCCWRMLDLPNQASSRYTASFIWQLLKKEAYISIPAVIASLLLALGIHYLCGKLFHGLRARRAPSGSRNGSEG